jgi:16S rRNA (cytidine1402-2'-O)-methyltransferase
LEQIVDIKGEFVIIVQGNNISKRDIELDNLNELSLEEHYEFYEKQGIDKKEIIKKIAKDRNTNKNEIYQYFLNK